MCNNNDGNDNNITIKNSTKTLTLKEATNSALPSGKKFWIPITLTFELSVQGSKTSKDSYLGP